MDNPSASGVAEKYGGSSLEDATYRRGRERINDIRMEEVNRRLEILASELRAATGAVDLRAQTANDTLERLVNANHAALTMLTNTRFEAAQLAVTKSESVAAAVDLKAQTANDTLERLVNANHQTLIALNAVQNEAAKAAVQKAETVTQAAISALNVRIEELAKALQNQFLVGIEATEKQISHGVEANKERISDQIVAHRSALESRIQDVLERLTMRYEQIDRSTSIAATQLDRRLQGMNEMRDAMRDQTTQMVSRHEIQAFTMAASDSTKKLEERVAMGMTRAEIISAISPLSENLRKAEDRMGVMVSRSDMATVIEPITDSVRRLENKGSNMDGRFWAIAIIPIIVSLLVTLGIVNIHTATGGAAPTSVVVDRPVVPTQVPTQQVPPPRPAGQ